MNIILLAPLYGNGGITSWTRKVIKNFSDEEYHLFPVSEVFRAKKMNSGFMKRILDGIHDIIWIHRHITDILAKERIDILHTTTSGSLGSFRDYWIGKLSRKNKLKSVMHCRYGCIPQIISRGGFWKRLMIDSMQQFDQIWVIDKKSFSALCEIPVLSGKVRLVPNSIEVASGLSVSPKEYRKYLFMANVYPEKGIYELLQAFGKVQDSGLELHIVGPCNKDVLDKIISFGGELWNKRIIYHGPMPNEQAVEFLKGMDVLVLPTYYESEAFPISILEAMSNGKLVISTPRAAIPDMLTAEDGTRCGILVEEKSVSQLKEAIEWVNAHHDEADSLCRKAYEKAYRSYRTDVVYELYRKYYRELTMSPLSNTAQSAKPDA